MFSECYGRDIESMNQIIASETIHAQRPGEDAFELCIQIGTPYEVGTDPNEWACPVALTPLHKRLCDAHGGSALQALCLASSLALELLADFRAQGGRLFYPEDGDFPLEAYAFGVAVREPRL